MRRAEREALALGLLHGPVELVPVSSSGHVAALPWLLGWEVAGWEAERRKELEVALHAGTLAALLIMARPRRPRPALLAAAALPPGIAGLALERRIEQRLGTPPTLAAGLLAGGLALVLADRAPVTRAAENAGWPDGAWLGLAQATALIPGVSRSGATVAAARVRGFSREDASRLSWEVALPVLAGADKFLHLLVNWDQYLAPAIANLTPLGTYLMVVIGVVEIVAGLVVFMRPRFGGYLVAAWLLGIIVNLLLIPGYYDVALRDFGLMLGALALARLSERFPGRGW
jgi:undecaprenyl-diphosphatase